MASEIDSIQNLIAAKNLLTTSLQQSVSLSSALAKTGSNLDRINQTLPALEATLKPNTVSNCVLKNHLDGAIDAATAVLIVYRSVHDLQKSLLSESDPCCSDVSSFLDTMKRAKEALNFLSESCKLAIQWLKAVVDFLECNEIAYHRFILSLNKSIDILEIISNLKDRFIDELFHRLDLEFNQLLTQHNTTCPIPLDVTKRLHSIIDRLDADDANKTRLTKCFSIYARTRSLVVRTSLKSLHLDYLTKPITHVEEIESDVVDQWLNDLVLMVKHVLEVEYNLCNDIFGRNWVNCFPEIARESRFIEFLQFGKKVSQSKKGPIKLLRMLDIFAVLDDLRFEMNKLFGDETCVEIKRMTRELIREVINGACEIFYELPIQVEHQRYTDAPSNGGVPRLVSFVTDFCNKLLSGEYMPVLAQMLMINHSWRNEKYHEGVVIFQIYNIIKQVALNLDSWSRSYEDIALSYFFMMNNHFHFSKLRDTKIGDMMGKSWLEAHSKYVEYYAELYLKESWGKILADLHPTSENNSSKAVMKKRVKGFNESFDQMYKKQSKWDVTDEKLRGRMCELVVKAFVPVYASYLQRYDLAKHVKYTSQSVEMALYTLFQPELRISRNINTSKPSPYVNFIHKFKTRVKTTFIKDRKLTGCSQIQ